MADFFLHVEEFLKIYSQIKISTYVFSVAPFQKMEGHFQYVSLVI